MIHHEATGSFRGTRPGVRTLASRIRAALAKPALPILFFFAGVTYDSVTLTRIDRLFDNLILLLYLLLLGLCIVLKGRADRGLTVSMAEARSPSLARWLSKAEPYYGRAIQFLFGGLFSAYTIFYSRSASFTTTAIFFALLVVLLVANEFLHARLTRLSLLVMLYAVVAFGFFTFFLPVLTGWMNAAMFLLGAVLSLLLALRLVELIDRGTPGQSRWEAVKRSLPAGVAIAVLVAFYFLNWIPPVPLSLKFGGVYHHVAKSPDGFHLTFEEGPWYRPLKRSDDPFHGEGPIYCLTAVFAPVDLKTTIYHRWQYRSRSRSSRATGFSTTDTIPIQISGGREEGYRGYTVKQRVVPGDWRVDVETEDGRIIGRIAFRVEAGEAEGNQRTIVY